MRPARAWPSFAPCATCPRSCPGPRTTPTPLPDLCARLAEAFGVAPAALPVVACGPNRHDLPGTAPDTLTDPLLTAETDPAGAAAAIGRRIAARRLALGFNDRFDGSVYS